MHEAIQKIVGPKHNKFLTMLKNPDGIVTTDLKENLK